MVRKNVLDEIGWFDERFFMYGEDVDLCRRSIEAGWKLYYMSEAQIIHLVGGASRRATNQFSTLMKCESISKLMQKYYGVKGRRLYSIGIFIGAGFRIAALMLIGAGSKIAGGSVGINHQGALRKYLAMIKWSLKLQKAMIRT